MHLSKRPFTSIAVWTGMCSILTLLTAGFAQARSETLRWTHPEPSRILRFEAHVGPSPSNYDRVFDLGVPATSGGIHSAPVTVGDDEDVFIALRAIGNDGTISPFSVERARNAPAAPPPPPPDPDPEPDPDPDPDPPPAPPPPGGGGGGAGGGGALLYDFEGASGVDGWVDTAANNSMTVDDSLFSAVSAGAGMVFTTSASGSNVHSHVTPAPSVDTNYEVRASLSAANASSGIGLTAYSSFPTSNRYYRIGTSGSGGTFRIASHPTLSCSTGDPDTGVTIVAGESYMVRLRIERLSTENRIEAAVWVRGTPEPTVAQATCVDRRSNRPVSGTVGVWSSSSGAKYWDDIEVRPLSTLEAPRLLGITRVD